MFDIKPLQAHFAAVKFLLRQFLMIWVILGLAGQGAAFAVAPCAAMQAEQASAKSAPMPGMTDCDMSQHKADNGSAPCKDMTLGCLTMAGCAALAAIDSTTPITQAPRVVAGLDPWPTTPSLYGRNVAPELDPPSLFG